MTCVSADEQIAPPLPDDAHYFVGDCVVFDGAASRLGIAVNHGDRSSHRWDQDDYRSKSVKIPVIRNSPRP